MTKHEGSPLLIATNNKGKIQDLQELLEDLGINLLMPEQIGVDLDVIEDGRTYAENAAKKALAFAHASGLISLADDSGLEVDILGGAPGIYSARYGAENGRKLTDTERCTFLIQNLQGKSRPWAARFHATIAIAIPPHYQGNVILNEAKDVYIAEGICEGEIIPEERGTGGFGYDPIFLLPELGKTMAELSMKEKNRLSHRARAVMNAKGILEKLFAYKSHQK